MSVALCCIGRLENQYAREFVAHYKKLGFDKIFIYDNNQADEEHFEEVIQEYVDDGFVDIVNYRDKKQSQLDAYNDCYLLHGKEYDWFAFFDFDEFLIIEQDDNIQTFLKQFQDFQCILVNWMIMDDNNLVTNDGRPLMERFTHPMDFDRGVTYSFSENCHVKAIVRGGLDSVLWKATPHSPSCNLVSCDTLGRGCLCSPLKKYTFKGAYIKHFTTKTIEEWLEVKKKRGYPDGNSDWFEKNDAVAHFFLINEHTDEKDKFAKEFEKTPQQMA